ncbi:MAG: beta-ketoacyl-ACP synthase 3 [Phycisphaerae bacterium]|nr:beta-ketoacyl-ACP synthase 3 [Phycisphaerae bacterium]
MAASKILGTGHFLPEKVVTNFDIMKRMETSDEFIVSRTGVHTRRHAEADVSATDLAEKACRAAVADACLTMDDIDLLVMNTITPDHADPGSGFFLQAKLGMTNTPVYDIKEQCAGLIYGIALGDSFITTGKYRHVLIVCAEVLSKRIDGSNDGRNIAILLGDGAGAVVLGPSDYADKGILYTKLGADGRDAKALYTAAPGTGLNRADCINTDDVAAGRVHFRMDGKAVFENGVAKMSQAVVEALQDNGIGFGELDLLIPHQANLRMLEAIIQTTKAPAEKVFANVDKLGNMASACLPVALDQAIQGGRIKQDSLVLLVAFGSGFVWAAALIRF